ncbi:MAG: hypothetical protein HS116_21090 [Planctomycetes bacterium]|nr:hypothetical protein [Planctomycetota bacterium]
MMLRLDEWMEAYKKHLTDCVREMPDQYAYGADRVPAVVERMRAAIKDRSFCHDSAAIKRTCKQFGIKHTHKAIDAFLKGACSHEAREPRP